MQNKIIHKKAAFNVKEMFDLRSAYLNKFIDVKIKKILNRLTSSLKISKIYDETKSKLWGDVKFHIDNRIHLNNKATFKEIYTFGSMFSLTKQHTEHLRKIILDGCTNNHRERTYYDLSILPLNIVLGKNVIDYFIPPSDYFDFKSTNQEDPYGIISGKSRSYGFKSKPTAIKYAGSNLLLGANKFTHTLLFNVDFHCPIGCSDCYKARIGTREYFTGSNKQYSIQELGEVIIPKKSTVIEQAKQTVAWLNEDKRGNNVYDIIISGGEPLMFSNELIEQLLSVFKKAKYLKILRICTGTIFLGLPFRIDTQLMEILRSFSDETGVRITIQAHIGNSNMISPESIIAIQKIKKAGFNIYAQIPIKNNINFFLEDPKKTIAELSLLLQKLVIADVEPYMFIVDMHPSTNEYYVPIEPLLQVWGDLIESHDYPGIERPRTLSVLFEQGNVVLSGNTLFAMEKKVNKTEQSVTYKIPRVGSTGYWKNSIKEYFEYTEPLILGLNDDPHSLFMKKVF
ncbi:MAG: 4Fe-4S cluster-binding domain-containing protein [Ignavibacteria bacterium]|nr:4Fe-4S cluster-binding domain-containing protein [Ignavibacteria bacterium]